VTSRFRQALDNITHVRGVRGALLVTSEDGLVVADALMEGIRGDAVAALAASLTAKLTKAAESAGVGYPHFVHLQAQDGTLVGLPTTNGVLVVVVADRQLNVGLVRLEMLRAAEAIG